MRYILGGLILIYPKPCSIYLRGTRIPFGQESHGAAQAIQTHVHLIYIYMYIHIHVYVSNEDMYILYTVCVDLDGTKEVGCTLYGPW